jgi:GntR family transcriptional regulator, arabinose operon transcriptional repressor
MENPKYRIIFEALHEEIFSRRYQPGGRLPSEAELVRRFGASRMTVLKAIKELQALGLVSRRAGSGTYVATQPASGSHVFGLLIPSLGQTEIFEAICQGMMLSPQAKQNSLLWGHSISSDSRSEEVADRLCQQYISKKVSGVFFAPIEHSTTRHETNRKVAAALERARIPIVLLDRCLAPFPKRSKYDLIAIDNHRAGYMATEHLVKAGARRIGFFARPDSAPTVEVRISGYRQALAAHPCAGPASVWLGDADDPTLVRSILKKDRPDALLCANDLTAGHLMHTLLDLGKRIPEDIRIVGFDDVKYARLLPVPLTTVHQPCHNLGKMALSIMLDRIAYPDLPTRDVLLSFDLVVRKSCGGT